MGLPDEMIVETTSRMLAELCGQAVVEAGEAGTWPADLWQALEESGLTLAWVPEAWGGPGASLADGFAVARLAAGAAAPVPVAETLLAGWLLAEAGIASPAGPMTVAPVEGGEAIGMAADGTLRGVAEGVPFAARCRHMAVVAAGAGGPVVALVDAGACGITPGAGTTGDPRDRVSFDAVTPRALATNVPAGIGEWLRRMGAAMRAHQIAGALDRALEQSLQYAQDRVQFGRPIAKFQAVQHNLAVLAGEAAAAAAAADAATGAIERHGIDDDRALIAVASAKIRAGEAAGAGAALAHQVHGAIGFTREYSLQQRTRRLWAWRDEFGPETVWALELGRFVAAEGADALWPRLTSI